MINWTWANAEENQEGKMNTIHINYIFHSWHTLLDLLNRCTRLRDLGIEEKLKIMEKDLSRDVRDRASTALNQLREVLAKNDM